MSIVKIFQIILYLAAIVLLIIAASPMPRRWRIELIAYACALAAFALPLLASAAG